MTCHLSLVIAADHGKRKKTHGGTKVSRTCLKNDFMQLCDSHSIINYVQNRHKKSRLSSALCPEQD
jgi:hypothetical protein